MLHLIQNNSVVTFRFILLCYLFFKFFFTSEDTRHVLVKNTFTFCYKTHIDSFYESTAEYKHEPIFSCGLIAKVNNWEPLFVYLLEKKWILITVSCGWTIFSFFFFLSADIIFTSYSLLLFTWNQYRRRHMYHLNTIFFIKPKNYIFQI